MVRPVSILIVDDHPLFIEALRLALRPVYPDARLVVALTLEAALKETALRAIDLVLLDLVLPDAGGVEAIAKVRDASPESRLVVVSGRDDVATVSLARALGATGFISKGASLVQIQDALSQISTGHSIFPSAGTSELATAVAALTPTQARVLAAVATGKLNKQIAFEMGLAEATVKSHLSAVFKRLGVLNRTQALLKVGGSTS